MEALSMANVMIKKALVEFYNSASTKKTICRSLPDWDNFFVEFVEFYNSTNTNHRCEHNIGRFLLKYFYKWSSGNGAIGCHMNLGHI